MHEQLIGAKPNEPGRDPLLSARPEVGVLLLRVVFGAILVYGTQDNIFSAEHMREFRDFLAAQGFPAPMLSAYVSAYAQFIGGLLILVGAATRLAALVMAINFVVALAMVHVGLPFSANISPVMMLTAAVFFLLYGAGPHSVDAWLARRGRPGWNR